MMLGITLINDSDASVGAPTEASGIDTNKKRRHPIASPTRHFPSKEGKRGVVQMAGAC